MLLSSVPDRSIPRNLVFLEYRWCLFGFDSTTECMYLNSQTAELERKAAAHSYILKVSVNTQKSWIPSF